MTRRTALKRLAWGFPAVITLFGCERQSRATAESEERELERARERMKAARDEDAREVELLYSTKPVRVRMGRREYVIPANHFGPKEKNEPGFFDAGKNGFGFFVFLPAYEGYTKENWRDPFDRRRISILQVSTVDKSAVVPILGGGSQNIEPANYGEPRARFENRKSRLEAAPSYDLYGLKGYRWKGSGQDGITWAGLRSNGEFFFFESSLAPGEPPKPGITNPLCEARYYSEREDLFIAYHYSQDHIAKWLAIDDAIWSMIHRWQVK